MASAHSPSSALLLCVGVARWTDRRTRYLLSGVYIRGWERRRTAAQIHIPDHKMPHRGHGEGGPTEGSVTGSRVTEEARAASERALPARPGDARGRIPREARGAACSPDGARPLSPPPRLPQARVAQDGHRRGAQAGPAAGRQACTLSRLHGTEQSLLSHDLRVRGSGRATSDKERVLLSCPLWPGVWHVTVYWVWLSHAEIGIYWDDHRKD